MGVLNFASSLNTTGIIQGIGKLGLKSVNATARFAARQVTGNVAQQTAFGAVASGAYSFATSDNKNITNRLREASADAMFGAMAGGAFSAGSLLAKNVGKKIRQGHPKSLKDVGILLKNTKNFGQRRLNTLQSIANNATPLSAAAGIAIGGYATMNAVADYGSRTKNSNRLNININQEAAQQQAGQNMFGGAISPQATVMPMYQYKQLQNSTNGLVNGLHQRRHG